MINKIPISTKVEGFQQTYKLIFAWPLTSIYNPIMEIWIHKKILLLFPLVSYICTYLHMCLCLYECVYIIFFFAHFSNYLLNFESSLYILIQVLNKIYGKYTHTHTQTHTHTHTYSILSQSVSLFVFLTVFFKIHLYWSIIASQCCVSFCCTAKWISHTYTYIPSFLDFLPI